jgi:hypothetical protein
MVGFLIALLVVGSILALARNPPNLAWWRLKRSRRTAIDKATAEQLVKLVGQVSLGPEVLQAPLTGSECACYFLTVDDIGSENGGRLVEVSEGAPFSLKDSDVTIVVHPFNFRIIASQSTVVSENAPRNTERLDYLERYLEREADQGKHQGTLAALRSQWPLKIREMTIRDGATVAAYGYIETQEESNGGTSVRLTCPDDGALLISDDPASFS